MINPYGVRRILTEPHGNNTFAWRERSKKYGKSPTLTIPNLIKGTLDDIVVGEDIVFEEMEDGLLRSCRGLQHFVKIKGKEIVIFDNHNHALFFWLDAIRRGVIQPGFELIHIDEHSDLWENIHDFDIQKAIDDASYAWDFVNLRCNVGNYIQPALRNGLVGNMIRIENEHEIDKYTEYSAKKNTVLNLDIDIFAPELDHISTDKKIRIIRNLMKQVSYVTIATSPYFIDQGIAIEKIRELMLNI